MEITQGDPNPVRGHDRDGDEVGLGPVRPGRNLTFRRRGQEKAAVHPVAACNNQTFVREDMVIVVEVYAAAGQRTQRLAEVNTRKRSQVRKALAPTLRSKD